MIAQDLRKWQLRERLAEIAEADTDYERRYVLVLDAMHIAATLGYPTGYRIDPAEPEWPVAYIHLPNAGQVSWHMPQFPDPWDGHDVPEKLRRCRTWHPAIQV